MSIQSLHGLNSYVMPEYSFRKVNALSLDLYVHHASLNLYSTRTTIKNYEDIRKHLVQCVFKQFLPSKSPHKSHERVFDNVIVTGKFQDSPQHIQNYMETLLL